MGFNEEILYFILNNCGECDFEYDNFYPIHYALFTFNMPLVKYLYEKYRSTAEYFIDLLHASCMLNQIESVKYFVDTAKIDVEKENEYGYHPIHQACKHGYLPIVQFLISRGADPNSKTKQKLTPLLFAIKKMHYSIVKYLCENTEIKINCVDKHKYTALHYACVQNNFEMVKYLLEHGCNPNLKNDDGVQPCFYTTSEDIIKYIAKINEDKLPVDSYGRTLLHYSAYINSPKLIKYFISLNMDKDLKDGNGLTPLHHTSLNGSLEAAKYLISHQADKDARDNYGRTPLHYAYFRNKLNIADYLISIGADQTIDDENGRIPIELKDLCTMNFEMYLEIRQHVLFFTFNL